MSKGISLADLPAPTLKDLPSPKQQISLNDLPSPSLNDLPPPISETSLKTEFNPLESAGLGAAQGGTLGFADEIEGGLRAIPEAITSENKLTDLYQKYRDISRARYKKAEQENPLSYFGGNLGAGVGTALIPGLGQLNLAKAATLGGTTALGSSEADLTEGDISGVVKDTGFGALLGAGTFKLGEKLQKFFSPEARKVAASKQAASASGVKPSKEFGGSKFVNEDGSLRRATLNERSKDIGTTALDRGTLPTTGGSEAMYNATQKALDDVGSEIGPVITNIQQKVNLLSPEKVKASVGTAYDKVEQRLKSFLGNLRNGPEGTKIANEIEKDLTPYIVRLKAAGNDPAALNELKKGIWGDVRLMGKTAFEKRDTKFDPSLSAYKQIGGMIAEQINDLGNFVEPKLGDTIAKLNRDFGNLHELEAATFKLVGKDQSKQLLTPKNALLAGAAAAGHTVGSPLLLGGAIAAKTAEAVSGHPLGRLVQMTSAKVNNKLAQGLETETGKKLVQDTTKGLQRLPGVSSIEENLNNTTRVTDNLYSAPDSELQNAAKTLSENGLTDIGNNLNDAISSGDRQKKNNMIFLIKQNKKARKALGLSGA